MGRAVAPVALLAAVSACVFGLAKWHPLTPSTPSAAALPKGDAHRGEAIFQSTCAGCHGAGGKGGGVGPTLAGSGLAPHVIATTVASGRGIMPAGLVKGQQAADVVAYVASIASK
jgi:mono/diheme cytochrome c family protein